MCLWSLFSATMKASLSRTGCALLAECADCSKSAGARSIISEVTDLAAARAVLCNSSSCLVKGARPCGVASKEAGHGGDNRAGSTWSYVGNCTGPVAQSCRKTLHPAQVGSLQCEHITAVGCLHSVHGDKDAEKVPRLIPVVAACPFRCTCAVAVLRWYCCTLSFSFPSSQMNTLHCLPRSAGQR